jgi:hypothetical protein
MPQKNPTVLLFIHSQQNHRGNPNMEKTWRKLAFFDSRCAEISRPQAISRDFSKQSRKAQGDLPGIAPSTLAK